MMFAVELKSYEDKIASSISAIEDLEAALGRAISDPAEVARLRSCLECNEAMLRMYQGMVRFLILGSAHQDGERMDQLEERLRKSA